MNSLLLVKSVINKFAPLRHFTVIIYYYYLSFNFIIIFYLTHFCYDFTC